MQFDKDLFRECIGNIYESNLTDMLNSIDSRAEERCPVSPSTLELVHIAATESYLTTLKTIEDAIIACFSCEHSDS